VNEAPAAIAVNSPERGPAWAHGLAGRLALVLAIVRRDLVLHYRHTRLGILWGILPPLLAAGALDLFLGRFAAAPAQTGGAPYALFLYAGMVPWQFFARAASTGAGSVVSNVWILSQVAFPRGVLPLAASLVGALDLLVGSAVVFAIAVATGHAPGASLLWFPAAVVPLVVLSVSVATCLAAAAVRLRDVVPATSYALQLLFLASPVLYSLSAVGDGPVRALCLANPMTGILEAFRAAWLGTPLSTTAYATSLAGTAVLALLAIAVLARLERRIGDLP
jgi:lipopolysaccharide transport system permease protein